MDRPKQFMDSALVAWVKLFDDHDTIEEVRDIADGVIFHKIMNAVDPNTYGLTRVKRNVNGDVSSRLQNLQLAVNSMTHFYITAQQQLVLAALPEISSIAHEPTSDKSLDELEKFIILLLGCAIQSDHKVQLIEQMKNMGVEQQQALIFYIQKITETTEFVCSLDWNDLGEILKPDLEALCRTAYVHLQRVAKERTGLFDMLVDLTLERDFYKEQMVPASDSINKGVSPSPQINPEIIELKKQARGYQEEIDRKTDLINDLERELEQVQIALQKLTLEKRELLDDAKATRAYRDEVEALKVQNAKIEKLEADVVKYRQRAEDSEYLKKRVTELKQQNELMAETKTLLEQKVATLTSRADTVDDLQAEVASLKVQVDALNQEKQMDLERIEELVAQTARLELENKNNQEQIAQLLLELETERERMSAVGMSSSSNSETSLGFEMTEADLAQRAKLHRLEKETREMEKSMEALRHSQAKVAELEKTNKKLYSQNHSDKKDIIKLREEVEMLKVKASRVDKLQSELSAQREKLEEASRLQSRLKELKSRNEQIMESKAMLEDEVENLQGKIILLDELKGETAQLKAQVDSLTSEHVDDQSRIQELMEQNAQLELEKQRCVEKIDLLTAELEHSGSKSDTSSKLTVLTPSRVSETDMATKAKLQRLEKESKEMEKSMETLRHAQAKVTELEKTNKKLNEKAHSDMKEIIRLKEEIQSYRTKTNRLERRQSSFKLNNSDKNEEMEAARGKIGELKQQNMLLVEAKALYEEELSSFHAKLEKLGELQGENAALKVKVSSLEQEKEDDSQRMQDLMQENAQLVLERDRNVNDMDTLKSELDKLKLAAASKASEVPYSPVGPLMTESELANRAKLLRLEKDHRDLQHNYDLYKQRTERVASEMEKTNKKLNTQIHNDRKEIVRLKEELKHEKDVAGTLTRQVEHLQKMVSTGTNNSPLGHVEQKKIEELGTKFDEALSQSLAIKEERISQLELRLEESLKENGSLRDDISALRKELIKAQANKNGPIGTSSSLQSRESKEQLHEAIRLREKNAQMMAGITDCKHIIKQQQHKIDTMQERYEMLEQLNDTLEEEKKTLLLQVNKLLEQNQNLLMKTLESKDQALEEERVFSDRLDELEKDKARLSEQLISQQKESMAREIDMLRKREKSKNLLKKGLKKLKGKFQTRSHTFELPDTGLLQGAGSGTSFSPHHTLPAAYKRGDGSWSSNQSISSGSHHSDSHEELDHTGSAHDVTQLVPRRAAFAGHSPVTLRQPKTQSLIVPPTYDVSSPYMVPERHNDIMSLEEFLAETNKTPNRRKLMEIKRASVATPPVTPRGSMLFGINIASSTVDQAELQDFLRKFQADDALSIPELNEEDDLDETGRLSSRQRSGRSCSSSGSTTQEETTCDVNSSSNNNNNNNNRLTPPLHPLLISSNYHFTANDTVIDPNQERGVDHMPQNCHLNEVKYRSNSSVVVENRLPPSTSICVGGNIPSATANTEGKKLERKKFYGSLADLASRKTTERHKRRHKSTENLLDMNTATLDEREPLPFNSHALNLSGLTTTTSTTSNSLSPSPEKNKAKKKLFKWRRNSQSATKNQLPFQPLTEREESLQPFTPVPHLVSVHYV